MIACAVSILHIYLALELMTAINDSHWCPGKRRMNKGQLFDRLFHQFWASRILGQNSKRLSRATRHFNSLRGAVSIAIWSAGKQIYTKEKRLYMMCLSMKIELRWS
jgi:hypothetical protein